MDALNTLFNWVTNFPGAISNTGINAAGTWIGQCLQGSCGSYPQEVWNGLGTQLQSVTGLLGSAAGLAWANILAFLPDGGLLPQEYHNAAIYFGNSLQKVSFIVPVDTLINCLTLIVAVKMSLWSFHILRVMISFVRGVPVERFSWNTVPDGPYTSHGHTLS